MRLLSSALLFFLGCWLLFPPSSSASSVCEYAECKETAAEILSNLNEKVDPCHDFYQYSCGGGAINTMSISKIETVLKQRIASDLYADDNLKNHGSKAVREAKKLYDDCISRGEGYCNSVARDKCYFAFFRVYTEKYFPVVEHTAVERLVSNIRSTFVEDIVNNISWIDPKTKKLVFKNLRKLQLNVGYPEWLLDDNELDMECQGLRHDRWPIDPLSVNAWYRSLENQASVTIPAGVLHGSVFSRKVPNYMNYGGAGYIAGHEISHGIYLWTQETSPSSGRDSQFQCVLDQLQTIPLPNGNPYPSGIPYLNEMIGDIAAINASLTAYRKLQSKIEEQKMPGLTHFTNQQLFFLSFANTWCSNSNLFSASSEWPDWSLHPDKFYRIVIPAINSPDFAKAFNCPVGSRMNPVRKSRLW